MIEHGTVEEEAIAGRINEVLDKDADVIVLACTHYHWIEDEIRELAAGKAQVIQPEPAVIEELRRVLAQLS
jgi:glutamate racemase